MNKEVSSTWRYYKTIKNFFLKGLQIFSLIFSFFFNLLITENNFTRNKHCVALFVQIRQQFKMDAFPE